MPQFDFTTYLSQIFWFSLCFATLYFFTKFVILPRINDIMSKRNDLIETDTSLANEIELKTKSINNSAQAMLQKANEDYLKKIEEILKNNNSEREKSIEKLKKEIGEKVANSRSEIKKFISESKNKNTLLVEDLIQNIKNKILN